MSDDVKKVPAWKQMGYDSAKDLSGKISWEGGFNGFYFDYGAGVEKEYDGSKLAKAIRKLDDAYAEVRRLLERDGVNLDGWGGEEE